uniref:Rh blood group, D antigen n=2 Tax=Scleropages formosus TaxID=113540 RepID=A0A8C9SRH5_SCLFO
MAPQYAPSLWAALPLLAFLLETLLILLFTFCIQYEQWEVKESSFTDIYAELQDVSVMVFFGFGFLAAFLTRYSFSSLGFNLLVASFAVQWAVLMNGLLFSISNGKISVSMRSLTEAQMFAVSGLISMGAVLGKTNPIHLLLLALLEVTGFVANTWILRTYLKVPAVDSIMMLHIFGAFFGLMTSWALRREGLEPRHSKEKVHRKTGLFSMMGALFLWMFWPSFNSVLIDHTLHAKKLSVIGNTYLSLAASAVSAFVFSALTSPRGKMNVVHIQSSMLAGGVAMGVPMSASCTPWVAVTIGLLAGLLSTLGFRYFKPYLQVNFGCHDTCSILSVHGLPGILGWMAYMLIEVSHSDDLSKSLRFTLYLMCTLITTLGVSLGLGAITGVLLKWRGWRPPQDRKCFDDQAFWEFPHLAVHK